MYRLRWYCCAILNGGRFGDLHTIYQGCRALPFALAGLSCLLTLLMCFHYFTVFSIFSVPLLPVHAAVPGSRCCRAVVMQLVALVDNQSIKSPSDNSTFRWGDSWMNALTLTTSSRDKLFQRLMTRWEKNCKWASQWEWVSFSFKLWPLVELEETTPWCRWTRKLSYCKDDRAMCPIYRCPENFWESMAAFAEIFNGLLFRLIL